MVSGHSWCRLGPSGVETLPYECVVMGAVGAPVSLVGHAWGSTSTLQMGSRWGGNTQSSQSSLFGIEFLQCVAVGWG